MKCVKLINRKALTFFEMFRSFIQSLHLFGGFYNERTFQSCEDIFAKEFLQLALVILTIMLFPRFGIYLHQLDDFYMIDFPTA